MVGGLDGHPRDVGATDGVKLPVDQRRRGLAQAIQQVLQVLTPEVMIAALAAFGECGVVVLEPMDLAVVTRWQIFRAVLVWSRIRFVSISRDQTRATTLAMLAECFDAIGGGPQVVLADRIACLRGPIVAGRVAHPNNVRFAGTTGSNLIGVSSARERRVGRKGRACAQP